MEVKMLINGKYVDKDEKIDVFNPYNNEIVGNVPIGDRGDVKNAIIAANNAKAELADFSAMKVSNCLFDAYENLKSQKEELAKIITLETGKTINDSLFEMKRSCETLKLAAEEAKRIYGETIPLDAGLGGKGFLAFTQKIPLGVVAAITPFNYPVNLAIHKLAPAIASKNTVILKPSRQAPLAAMKMAEIIANEFPAGVINTVTGYSSEIGDELTVNEDVNKISFTGSVATGLLISNRAGMKKVTMELGGNDPVIVLKDADLEKAAIGVANGSYTYSGQLCIGVKRIIVEETIADEFIELLVNETKKLKIGNPLDVDTDIGPLINENSAISVEKSVENAISSGAKLVLGGNRKGTFFEPTILDNIDSNMEIVINETFGPISPIIRVNDVDEAIKVANNTQFGLQSGVFTESIHNAFKCANEIESGTVFINKQSTFRTDNMPFGGFKYSGIGKEGVKYAVEDMTRTKLIALNLR
ncbi:MAG: lactaldehyde dehydrogenase [Methanobacteriaceae archaeon]